MRPLRNSSKSAERISTDLPGCARARSPSSGPVAPSSPVYSANSFSRPTNEVRSGGRLVRGASARLDSVRSEEHTSELQSRLHLVCRLLLEKKKKIQHK